MLQNCSCVLALMILQNKVHSTFSPQEVVSLPPGQSIRVVLPLPSPPPGPLTGDEKDCVCLSLQIAFPHCFKRIALSCVLQHKSKLL